MKWWKLAGCTAGTFIVLASAGCSRQAGVLASGPSFTEEQHPPFEQLSSKGGISPTASISSSGIPAGTPVCVRIESIISSTRASPGDSFQAVLDSPIVVDGITVAPRGSAVTGKVLAAKAASPGNEFGYVRLTITAIALESRTVPVRTAGIFVKGVSVKGAGVNGSGLPFQGDGLGDGPGVSGSTVMKDVEFPAARRLTFRLTQSVPAQD